MPFATDPFTLRAASVLACLLLGACTSWPGAEPPPVLVPVLAPEPVPLSLPVPPPAPSASPADLATRSVLAFGERVRQMGGPELAREMGRLGDGTAGPQAAVELALVLAQMRNPADTVRALSLLDGVQRSVAPEAAAWQPIARLLSARLAEQRRLEELVERQNQQARDTQRRVDQLNEKLEALKAIERSLTARPAASAPGAAKGAP